MIWAISTTTQLLLTLVLGVVQLLPHPNTLYCGRFCRFGVSRPRLNTSAAVGRDFVLVGEAPHHSFGADLLGQVYEREL